MANEINLLSSKQLGVNDSVIAIELADRREIEAIMGYREATTPEERESYKEDAYVQNLIQMREGKLMGKKAYEAEAVEAVTGVEYDHLAICAYEDYNIN